MTSEIEFHKPILFSAILPTILFTTISFHSVPLFRVVFISHGIGFRSFLQFSYQSEKCWSNLFLQYFQIQTTQAAQGGAVPSLGKSEVFFHVCSIRPLGTLYLLSMALAAIVSLILDFLFEEKYCLEKALPTYGWLCPTPERLGVWTSIAKMKLGYSN